MGKWWKQWKQWFGRRRSKGGRREALAAASDLVEEVALAQREWANAWRHFEYAVERDHVDYAIYAIEAAEKRYVMLLRRAKDALAALEAQRGRGA